MTIQPTIRVDGLKELRSQLRRVKDSELDAEMKQIHLEIAREVIAKALPKVPVRTGKLKASVRAAGTVRDAIGRAGSAGVPYAAPVHWGHGAQNLSVIRFNKQADHVGRKSSRANPFLWEAAQEIEQDVVDRYDMHVSRMLNRFIKETL